MPIDALLHKTYQDTEGSGLRSANSPNPPSAGSSPIHMLPENRPVRILSIDGGGIRGIIPALILSEIEQRTGKPISDLFDLVAGTSTGAILATALSLPSGDISGKKNKYTARDIVQFYELDGKRVFSRTLWKKIRAVGNLAEGKYSAAGLESVLEDYFGVSKLSESLTDLMIASYEIERRLPLFFKSSAARQNPQYDFAVKHIIRAATAAPTYFEPALLQVDGPSDYYALIDGGVFANNPAMCAYIEAKQRYPNNNNFLLVSLGTGELTRRLPYDKAKDWGAAHWGQQVFTLMCDGTSDMVDHQLSILLHAPAQGRRQYYRFQTRLDNNEELDDASAENIRELKLLGEHMIQTNRSALRHLCQQLLDCTPSTVESTTVSSS